MAENIQMVARLTEKGNLAMRALEYALEYRDIEGAEAALAELNSHGTLEVVEVG